MSEEGSEGGDEEVEAVEVELNVSLGLPTDSLGGEVNATRSLSEEVHNLCVLLSCTSLQCSPANKDGWSVSD